ncbi:hypothetical protein [Haloprofundus salinisoli]|uniref:hypothetical protein n=1 Tax=Haloprofundus salinisoli TaxID=2876193 RepID=UPI001CCC76F1|nr:hypothetical protein [Haloprofundus salinisoli]
MTDSTSASDVEQTRELPFDAAVVERTADETGVGADDLTDALLVLDAELLGNHSEYEGGYDYVTVDGRRAYLVDEAVWEAFAASFDLDEELLAAARRAHDEQARLLFDSSVESAPPAEDAVGVVVGVDTAEEMV